MLKHTFCKIILLAIFMLQAMSTNVFGQTCCSGGVPLSGNLGLPASDTDTWQVSLNYDLNVLRTLKNGTETLDERDRQRLTHSILLELGYTFSKRFSADLFLSFVRQERRIQNPGLPDQNQSTSGIGDGVLLLKYNLISSATDVLTIGVGPKIPIGASDVTKNGILLGADLQPGSGAWDGVIWGYFSHNLQSRKSMSYTFTSTYRYTGTNENFRLDQSYRFGSEFQGIFGVGDRVVVGKMLWDPSLSFRYRRAWEDQVGGNELPNTGGEWVFINPVLGFSITSKLAFNVGVELPLYANITGTQLTPTYRINTGFYLVLGAQSLDIQPLKKQ